MKSRNWTEQSRWDWRANAWDVNFSTSQVYLKQNMGFVQKWGMPQNGDFAGTIIQLFWTCGFLCTMCSDKRIFATCTKMMWLFHDPDPSILIHSWHSKLRSHSERVCTSLKILIISDNIGKFHWSRALMQVGLQSMCRTVLRLALHAPPQEGPECCVGLIQTPEIVLINDLYQ